MSPLASIVLGWAAVHGFVALFYFALRVRMRSGREYESFALASLGGGIYTAGSSLLIAADDLVEGALAQRIQMAAVAAMVWGFLRLLYDLLGWRSPVNLRLAYGWSVIALIAAALGLWFDADHAAAAARLGFGSAPDYPEARMRPAGIVLSVGATLIVGWALVHVIRHGRGDRDLAWMLVAGTPALFAWVHDSAVRILPYRAPYILEHVMLLSSIAIGYVLLRRFVRTDQELGRRTMELRQSYEELRHAQEELVRAEQLAAVGELSAVIAHELQNPLSLLKDAVSRLRGEDVGEPEEERLLAALDEESDRLNHLVQDLLTYARPVQPQYEPLDAKKLIEEAVESVRAKDPRAGNVDFELDASGTSGTLEADRDLLLRALANIVENAVEAMARGGRLTVRASDTVEENVPAMTLSVRDTGKGMDRTVRDKARDPFFTTRPSGTGLGLAIVDRVIRAHGGRMQLESSDEKGTTVTLQLPRTRRSSLPPAVTTP